MYLPTPNHFFLITSMKVIFGNVTVFSKCRVWRLDVVKSVRLCYVGLWIFRHRPRVHSRQNNTICVYFNIIRCVIARCNVLFKLQPQPDGLYRRRAGG